MYQAKLREDLISRLYQLGKTLDVPMPELAGVLLEMGIKHLERCLAEMGYVQPGSDSSWSRQAAQPNDFN